MNRVIVQTEGLTKTYSGGRIVALEDIDLTIEEGRFISILGPSGSGKTTLLNMIGTLDNPTRGIVFIDGVELSKVNNLNRFRAEKVGFVFQLHNLIPTLNAYENVQLPMYAIKMNAKQRKQRAMEMIEAVGLKDRLYHKPTMLSGGERQRVAIGRALMNEPKLLLADEPTGNLDSATGNGILEILEALNRAGQTIVMVTHDERIARRAGRTVTLVDGKIEHKNSNNL